MSDLLIPPFHPSFFSLITLFSFFPAFLPFIIDNCNYWSLFRGYKNEDFVLLFTIICPKINMNVVKTTSSGQ